MMWLWNYSRRWYYYRYHLCCLLLPHSTYFIRQFLVRVLFVLLFWRDYVYLGQLCLSKRVLCFLIHNSYVRSNKRYCFVRKYAAIPVQLEIFILQYIGWCELIIQTSIVNQFGCFCQFLMDNSGQSTMSLYIFGSCQLFTCCSNVLDCLRFFSTSSA